MLLSGLTNHIHAQDITDSDLKKYKIVIDSIETLKNQLTVTINNLAKGNGNISASRFNTLIPIINNEAKLTEAKATPDEIAYVKKAAAVQEEETKKFQKAYQSLIYDYVGDAVFTRVRNGLKTDTGLKKKYDALTATMRKP